MKGDGAFSIAVTHEKRLKIVMRDALLNHYRELVRAYFADTTEEGMISKYAKIRECEDIIVGIIGGPQETLDRIYQDEYWDWSAAHPYQTLGGKSRRR